jgi:hypothetical protein
MNAAGSECLVFDSATLLPAAWRDPAAAGPIRAFNPALLRDGAGWVLAYRVVLADGCRRLAACRLDAALRVIADSPVPLSDAVSFPTDSGLPEIARQWLADPRLYRSDGRVFVYWNSGWHEPRNHQFLQELDPARLTPIGAPRELILARGDRRPLEKNWTFFADGAGVLHAVYSILPHRVLRFSLAGTGPIAFDEAATTAWELTEYPPCHGGLRGGAPPVWHDGRFWSFCHSVHDGPQGYRYAAAVYCFSGDATFAPVAEPRQPLELGAPHRSVRLHPRLNPAVDEVIYPCGAAHDGAGWLISHGLNDERCAISRLYPAAVCAALLPR